MSFAGWLFRHTDEWRDLQETLSLHEREEVIRRETILRLNHERRDLQHELSTVRTQLRAMQERWQMDYARLALLTEELLRRLSTPPVAGASVPPEQVYLCCAVCQKLLPPEGPKIFGPKHASVQRVFCSMACVIKFQGGTFSA